MRTLLEMLTDYPMPLLRGIAKMRGVPLVTTKPMQAAEQLAAALTTAESVEQAIASLSAGAKESLAHLSGVGGRMTVASFARIAGSIRTFGVGSLEQAAPWRQPDSFAEELWYRGLIGRAFADTPSGAIEFFYIPTDILPFLSDFQKTEPSVLPITPAGPPAHPRSDAGTLLEDACTLLITVYHHSPRISDKNWREEDRSVLRQQLLEPTLQPLLLHLANGMGWLKTSRGRVQLVSDVAHHWLGLPRHRQAQTLFTAWRDDEGWNDLCHVPGLRCVESGWRNDPLRTRQTILNHLTRSFKDQDSTTWYRISDFIKAIKHLDPDFQRPDGDYASWYIQDVETGVYLRGFETWERVEGALIAYLLAGPLRALGLVRLGTESEASPLPTSFSLTQEGRWLLGLSSTAPPSQPSPLAVGDDFTITLNSGYLLLDRFRVARFALPLGAQPGPPWRYQIRRTSLAEAQKQGLTSERILAFLEQASGGTMPEKVTRALMHSAWPQGVRVRKARLLEASPQLSAQLRRQPQLAGYFVEVASPDILLVDERDWPLAAEALRKIGVQTVEEPQQAKERTQKSE